MLYSVEGSQGGLLPSLTTQMEHKVHLKQYLLEIGPNVVDSKFVELCAYTVNNSMSFFVSGRQAEYHVQYGV